MISSCFQISILHFGTPMSIITIARSLQKRSRSQFLLPISYHFTSSLSPSPPIIFSFFCAAFHQALSLSPQNPLPFRSFSTRNVKDPFDLLHHRILVHDPPKSGFLDSLKRAACFPSQAEALLAIDDSGIQPDINFVYSAIWELKQDWKLAFLAFKWGERWACVDHKSSELLVLVLGNHRKFNIAWTLVRDLYRSAMDTQQAMLIMIDRYAAANNPSKAIQAFHIMEKFKMIPDQEAFYFALNVLCKHGYIEEAEEFMLANKKLFPLETEAFNIILNGWSTICVHVLEAKRVWREMSKRCITPDATSYKHMISCFSKVGNLFDSVRLYDEMKKKGFVPGIEVYNSLVYVLTRSNCFEEALKCIKKMKEIGLQPDSTTYNSMICPLCEVNKLVEARKVLATMIEQNVSPTIETYHAFLLGAGFEGTLEVLNRMKMAGFAPTEDTFLLILTKFFKLKQPENALKVWVEMEHHDVIPNLTHYAVFVEGLARCGLLTEARKYYADMRSNGFSDDPKLQGILKEPVQHRNGKETQQVAHVKRDQHGSGKRGSIVKKRKKA